MNSKDTLSFRYQNGSVYKELDKNRVKSGRTKEQYQDVNFVSSLAQEIGTDAPILAVPCGFGRVIGYLSEIGFNELSGVDNSKGMLDEAKRAYPQVKLHEADARSFNLGRKFDLIMSLYDFPNHLQEVEDFEAFLFCVKNHLSEKGKFVFDVTLDFFAWQSCFSNGQYFDCYFKDPETKELVVVTQTREYSPALQILTLQKHYFFTDSEKEVIEDIKFRCYSYQEILTLLKYNGFEVEELFGDFQKGSFSSQSKKLVVVCRKKS